jgi:hypothetical protein
MPTWLAFHPPQTFNGNGGGSQLEYDANQWLGVVGDLAGYGATSTVNGALVGGAFSYLFGPRINFRNKKVTPFAQTSSGALRQPLELAVPGSKIILP